MKEGKGSNVFRLLTEFLTEIMQKRDLIYD
jgi:hypothetical protein